ncbi:MAG: peptidylprolyl isomerase [Lachnospiraceae bacterium]|nr:peptidylprolyl isomerase [Lachnospiraceae bacterium]
MAGTNYSASELLVEVNEAIQTILVGGQSYKIGSRSLTRADLQTLLDLRDDLTAQSAAEETGNLFADTYVSVFEGR